MTRMVGRSAPDRVVTYEAVDRGARCALGCISLVLLLIGVTLAITGAMRGGNPWLIGLGVLAVLAGAGQLAFMNSPARGRWEISFDCDERVVRVFCREKGTETRQEFPFEDIAAIELERITRDDSTGDNVPYLLPVLHLKNGEVVRLNERMSIKDPERAEEVVNQMRALVGLIEAEE